MPTLDNSVLAVTQILPNDDDCVATVFDSGKSESSKGSNVMDSMLVVVNEDGSPDKPSLLEMVLVRLIGVI